MSRAEARIAKAGESAIRAVHRLARTESQEAAREQRRENRRKVLLGSAVVEMIMVDSALSARIEAFMRTNLQRKSDLSAFDFGEDINFFARTRHARSEALPAPMKMQQSDASRAGDRPVLETPPRKPPPPSDAARRLPAEGLSGTVKPSSPPAGSGTPA